MNQSKAEIIQSLSRTCFGKDHYYPFGMRMSGQHYSNTELINKYLYNGKEIQEQTNYYDYGFRQMDVQLGRWHVVDAMAEKYFSTSPYAYVENDPVNHRDYLGLWSFPVYFNDSYGGTMSGSGSSWRGASFSGTIPRGFSSIMEKGMGGKWIKNSSRGGSGGGLNVSFSKVAPRDNLDIFQWAFSWLHVSWKTEDVWVWDGDDWIGDGEPQETYYVDNDPDGGDITRVDLSKKNAGELLLYNLKNNIHKKPYLKDLVKPSSFPKHWIISSFFGNSYLERGVVNIAGKNVTLTIVHSSWKNSPNTHLNRMYNTRLNSGAIIQVSTFAESTDISDPFKSRAITFDFGENLDLYNAVIQYFAGGSAPDFTYIKP